MIIRIVRMSFRPEALEAFEQLFQRTAPRIRAVEGCRRLELWKSVSGDHVRTTFSLWESEGHLDAYRSSELFRTTWARARELFSARAVAESYVLREADPDEGR
jgi:heme-degrading monooxygenase HmoA